MVHPNLGDSGLVTFKLFLNDAVRIHKFNDSIYDYICEKFPMLGCPLRHYDFYSENQAAINKMSLKIYNKRKAAELNDKNVKEQMNQTSILQAAQDSQKKSHEQIGVGTFVRVRKETFGWSGSSYGY